MKRIKGRAKKALERMGYRVESIRVDDALLYGEYPPTALAERRFINVGAGSFRHPYWTNVDYASEWYRSVQAPGFAHYDLTALEPLPFDDETVELAYTSHTIEHVGEAAVENLFAECHRVLRRGGGLRVTCPDAALMYAATARGNLGYWHWRRSWFAGPVSTARSPDEPSVYDYFALEVATPRCRFYQRALADAPELRELERLFRSLPYPALADHLTKGLEFDPSQPGVHISYWDEERLLEKLRAAGFADVYVSRRGQSRFAPMMAPSHFDGTKPAASLYVEGRKR